MHFEFEMSHWRKEKKRKKNQLVCATQWHKCHDQDYGFYFSSHTCGTNRLLCKHTAVESSLIYLIANTRKGDCENKAWCFSTPSDPWLLFRQNHLHWAPVWIQPQRFKVDSDCPAWGGWMWGCFVCSSSIWESSLWGKHPIFQGLQHQPSLFCALVITYEYC